MAEIDMSLPGGLYRYAINLDFVLDKDVDRFSFTVNGPQPTMSKYIAYDTLPGKNPFIAVTQDGLGNVVYDGGFPKFYNLYHNFNTQTFAQMNAAAKYLHNALNFCANKDKLAVGNRKVLLIGDRAANSTEYRLTGTGSYDFRWSMTMICRVAGFTPTFKESYNWAGGAIDPNFAELDQYAVVIFLSSNYYANGSIITNNAVTDLITYREAGNGIIFITDHGLYYNTTLEQADARPAGFYVAANRVIRNFGSFFSGDYDRSPVNVGYLRRTYGDHPLYNGMKDSEYIYAGKSESRIFVAQYPEYTEATKPTLTFAQDGKYIIRILAIMKDGTTRIIRHLFNVILGEFLYWRKDGVDLGNEYTTELSTNDFLPYVESSGEGTMIGTITRNGKKIANWRRDNVTPTTFSWLSGESKFPVANGDVFHIVVETPFNYSKELKITRYQPPISDTLDYAECVSLLDYGRFAGHPREDMVNEIMRQIAYLFPGEALADPVDIGAKLNAIRRYSADYLGEPTTAYIFATTAETEQAKTQFTTGVPCLIDAQSKKVYEYVYPLWVEIPELQAMDFLGAPRTVTGITNGIRFRLIVGGNIIRDN